MVTLEMGSTTPPVVYLLLMDAVNTLSMKEDFDENLCSVPRHKQFRTNASRGRQSHRTQNGTNCTIRCFVSVNS